MEQECTFFTFRALYSKRTRAADESKITENTPFWQKPNIEYQ